MNVPPGAAVPPAATAVAPDVAAAQDGGSLMDTCTVPMPGPGTEDVFPPQLTIITATTAVNRPSRKSVIGRFLKRRMVLEITRASAFARCRYFYRRPGAGTKFNSEGDHPGRIRKVSTITAKSYKPPLNSPGQPSPLSDEQFENLLVRLLKRDGSMR